MKNTENLFKGKFLTEAKTFRLQLKKIRAYVYDWDGVFNDGHKNESGSSSFSEVDSMGTNLLRFSHYLEKAELPFTAIITGEQNKTAASFSEREHFHALYAGIKNKYHALQHFCNVNNIATTEVAFIFDDVLDLSAAAHCGIRIMVIREANPLLARYAKKKKLADYFTNASGSNYAVRESAELIMSLNGWYENAVEHRVNYSTQYQAYLEKRDAVVNRLITTKDLSIQ